MPPTSRGSTSSGKSKGFEFADPPSPFEEESNSVDDDAGPDDLQARSSVDSEIGGGDVVAPDPSLSDRAEEAEVEEGEEEDDDDDDDDEEGNGDDIEDDEHNPSNRDDRFLHRSNSSFSIQNAFAPPFYNRPRTPLPPSPSLTSLLRPPFSTTTSRPTTPDSSENDTLNDTESAVTKSARAAATVPRASPKVPTYEYYGFVLYLLSSLAFLMYLLWSYLPSPFLHQLGIYYYPNRWWSLAIPSFLVMTLVYIYVALASYNTGYLTLPMDSVENIVDDAAHVAVVNSKGQMLRERRSFRSSEALPDPIKTDWRTLWNEGTDAVMDIPIGGVCQVLYG